MDDDNARAATIGWASGLIGKSVDIPRSRPAYNTHHVKDQISWISSLMATIWISSQSARHAVRHRSGLHEHARTMARIRSDEILEAKSRW